MFFCEICEIFNNIIFYRTSPVAASDSFRFPACNFIKKSLQQRCFPVNFAKFLRASFDRTHTYHCFLCLSVNFEKFSEHLFYRAPLGNCLFHVQVAGFQPADRVIIISQVLFKHFIKEREVAIPRHSSN